MEHTHVLRIPSAEPYGYTETMFEGTAEEAIAEQTRLARIARGEEGAGLPPTEWRELLRSIMEMEKRTEPVPVERLNGNQLFCLKEVRNYKVRINK